MLRAYRMHPPVGSAFTKPKPSDANELMWQIKNFHSFLWASGGCYSDFFIHNHRRVLLDEERLAGAGPGARRPPLSAATTSTRISTPTPSNTRLPTARSCGSTAA